MIYGDPFSFALQFEAVSAWNVPGDTWKNGIFSLYIDGERLFEFIDPVELKTTFSFYANAPMDELCINDLSIDAVSLYRNAESYFTGDSTELIAGLFDMTCTAMEDNACYLYFIKISEGDRLVWSVDNGEHITEKILPRNEISKTIRELQKSSL